MCSAVPARTLRGGIWGIQTGWEKPGVQKAGRAARLPGCQPGPRARLMPLN